MALIIATGGCLRKTPENEPREPENQTRQEETGGENNNIKPEDPQEVFTSGPQGDFEYPGGTPSGGYAKYMDAKTAAYDRIWDKIYENIFLSGYLPALSPFSQADHRIRTVYSLTGRDEEAIELMLSFFLFDDVECVITGDTYTIRYTTEEGNTYTDTCTYDAAADSLRVITTDGSGNEILFFEYVRTGEGKYAAQYHYKNEETGAFETLALFIGDDTAAFGMKEGAGRPSSIFGKTDSGIELVSDCDSRFILEGDEITIVVDGAENAP